MVNPAYVAVLVLGGVGGWCLSAIVRRIRCRRRQQWLDAETGLGRLEDYANGGRRLLLVCAGDESLWHRSCLTVESALNTAWQTAGTPRTRARRQRRDTGRLWGERLYAMWCVPGPREKAEEVVAALLTQRAALPAGYRLTPDTVPTASRS